MQILPQSQVKSSASGRPPEPAQERADSLSIRRGAVLLAGAAVLIFAAFRLDLPTRDFIRAHQVSPLLAAGRFVSRYGDFFEVVGAGAVCLLVAWLRKTRFWMRTFLLMIIAACLAGGASNVIKGVAGRVRPRYATDFGWHGPWYEGRLILIKSKFNSFPSGHTAVVSAFFGTLFLARRRIGAILLPAVAVVAASRVYIGAHFLSDVVAATVLGFFTAWLVMRFARPARRDTLLDGPGAAPW